MREREEEIERVKEKRGEKRETVKIQKRNTEIFFSRLEKSLVNLMGPPTYFFVFYISMHSYQNTDKIRPRKLPDNPKVLVEEQIQLLEVLLVLCASKLF